MLNRRNLIAAALAGASLPRLGSAPTPEAGAGHTGYLLGWDELVEIDRPVRFAVVDVEVSANLPSPIHAPWQGHVLAIGETLEKWTERIGEHWRKTGVNPSELVVAADPGDHFAAFAYFIATYLGYDAVVLDGGLDAIEEPVPQPSEMSAEVEPQPNPDAIRSVEDVRGYVGDRSVQILDARTKREWDYGHITGSTNLPYTDAIDGRSYKHPDELADLFAEADIDPQKPIVCYCATGPRASVLAMSALLAGATDVSIYLGSWTEWSQDLENNPINLGGDS